MPEGVSLVVSLWIKGNDVAGFEAFERAATEIVSDHGGNVEQVVRCSAVEGSPFEVHLVTFPSARALQEYREDPRLVELRPLRERVIARTEIWQGQRRHPYASQSNKG